MPDDLFTDVLSTAAYNGISFPVTRSTAPGGHDGVRHKSYGRRGADVEPTGLKEYTGTLVIPFFNDLVGWRDRQLWPDTYQQLIQAFEQNPIGQLQHPSKGTFRAFIESWDETLDADVRDGLILTVTWCEHNGEAGSIDTTNAQTPRNAPQTASTQAAAADQQMTSFALSGSTSAQTAAAIAAGALAVASVTGSTATGFVSVSTIVNAQLAFLEAAPRTPQQILTAIATMLAPVQANLAAPLFSTAAAYPVIAALEALQSTIFALRAHYMSGFDDAIRFDVPFPMPVWQISQIVYGDASRVQKILAANPIADPLLVPAGRVLLLLP